MGLPIEHFLFIFLAKYNPFVKVLGWAPDLFDEQTQERNQATQKFLGKRKGGRKGGGDQDAAAKKPILHK